MPKTIYLSCAPADWEATREFRTALESSALTLITGKREEIHNAWRFIACFSAGEGSVRYDREELLAATDRPFEPGWLVAVKLDRCHLPIAPTDWRYVPTFGPDPDWSHILERIIAPPATNRGPSNRVQTDELYIGGEAIIGVADVPAGTSVIPEAHASLEARTVTVDGSVKFTTIVVRDDGSGRR